MADEEALGAGGQEHVGAAGIDRRPRCRDTLDREGLIVERLVLVAARILDRQPGDAGRDAALHVGRDAFRLMGVARLEIGVHRQLGRGDDLGDVAERHVDGDGPVHVRQRLREGEARARRRQRLEAETAQIARRAGVPRVRDHEAAALVELAEGGACGSWHRHRQSLSDPVAIVVTGDGPPLARRTGRRRFHEAFRLLEQMLRIKDRHVRKDLAGSRSSRSEISLPPPRRGVSGPQPACRRQRRR